jgi:hypothetical protein
VHEDGATLRRLRLTADRAEDAIAAEPEPWTCAPRGQADAMARVASLIASGAGDSVFRRCVQSAVATGATPDELINMLRGVTRSVGIARVVAAVPAFALALGYNLDAPIEEPPQPSGGSCSSRYSATRPPCAARA